jgi:hypothetical protein
MLAIELFAIYGIGLGVLNLLTLGLILFYKFKKD